MNCSKIHYLLSLNLDGRLSSSKREVLLQHLDGCDACRKLDTEMHAAQDLALQLPRERMNAEFQDTLWNRIRAGEGTPDGVFHEAVPVATRVRYLATGAAAAAMFLLVLNWLGPDRSQDVSPRSESVSVAAVTPDSSDDPRTAAAAPGGFFAQADATQSIPGTQSILGSQSILDAQPVGLSPSVVAQTARQTFVRSMQDLKGEAPRLRKRLKPSELNEQKRRIAETVSDLRISASIMLWMADDEFIQLPGGMHAGLVLAKRGTTIVERSNKLDEFLLGLEKLDEIDCNDLESQFSVVCCDKLPAFLQGFSEQITCAPETGRLFRSMICVEPGVGVDSPRSLGSMLFFRRSAPQGR